MSIEDQTVAVGFPSGASGETGPRVGARPARTNERAWGASPGVRRDLVVLSSRKAALEGENP
jgi:hypothetical protein